MLKGILITNDAKNLHWSSYNVPVSSLFLCKVCKKDSFANLDTNHDFMHVKGSRSY